MKRLSAAAALAGAVFATAPAFARPATGHLDAAVGEERFLHAQGALLAAVVDPSIAKAELLPSGELLVSATGAGRTLLIVLGEGGTAVSRLRFHAPGQPSPDVHASAALLDSAKKVCGGFKDEPDGEFHKLVSDVSPGACRQALLALLDTDDYTPDQVEVTYSAEAVSEQLGELKAALKKEGLDQAFSVSYLGPTLRIQGKGTAAQKLALMRVAWNLTVGWLLVDDQAELVKPEEPKAKAETKAAEPEKAPEIIIERGVPGSSQKADPKKKPSRRDK